MHAYTTLGMLALAGSAMAAPQYWGNKHVVWETAVVTVVVGPDGQPVQAAAATPAAEHPHHQRPSSAYPTSSVVVSPPQYSAQPPVASYSQPSPTPSPKPEQPSPTPSPSPSASPAPSNPPSSGSGYLDIANQWRTKLGKPAFTHDDTLEANALKTCVDGKGQMVHELNPGTFGQTLAPGQPDEFERVFVGGWLCERPDLPGLDGICNTMSSGWEYNGQTGHADIIMGDYTSIGCANADGIWGCDYK